MFIEDKMGKSENHCIDNSKNPINIHTYLLTLKFYAYEKDLYVCSWCPDGFGSLG